jgi:hypothetical protein
MKHRSKVLPFAVFAAVSLAGCSHSGVESSSANKNGAEQSSALQSKEDIGHSRKVAVEAKVPAMGLIVSALRDAPDAYKTNNIATFFPIMGSATPIMGWVGNGFDSQSNRFYARMLARMAFESNIYLTHIYYKDLQNTRVWNDPATFQAQVRKDLADLPPAYKKQVVAQAVAAIPHHAPVTFNFTGSCPDGGNICYWINGASYVGGQGGVSVTKNGIPWYGGGRLSGRDVQVSLAHEMNTGVSRSKELAQRSNSSTEQSSSSSAGAKAEQ